MSIIYDKTGQSGWTVENELLQGAGGLYTGHPSPQVVNVGDCGIKINSCAKGTIRYVEISEISGAAIDFSASVGWNNRIIMSGFDLHDCYYGIYTHDGGEYAIFNSGFLHDNVFGARISSGNISLSDVIITKNSIGLYITGGSNDAHGVCSGLMLNHNNQNLVISGVTNGQTFDGCNFFGHILGGSNLGSIEIANSKGIVFNGGQMGSTSVSVDASSKICMRGVVMQGTVNFVVDNGAFIDAKNTHIMPGSSVTWNGISWNGNT
jgi:hypothetical protein